MGYIDMHCDTLMHAFFQKKEDVYDIDTTMVNFQKLIKGGCLAQFFAVFFPKPENGRTHWGEMPPDLEYFAGARKILLDSIAAHSDKVGFATDYSGYEVNKRAGKLTAFLTIEDGRAAMGSIGQLKKFYDDGVRLISLTWKFENCFGAPESQNPEIMNRGLTDFGREAVGVMNELGMIIDVSHLSDGGFYDVARLSGKPFVASHSNARAVSPRTRNLTDEMLKLLADKGGAAGLNFLPSFLAWDAEAKASRVENMVEQVLYMLKTAGEDVIAIGTDMDGFGGNTEIGSPEDMYLLFDALTKAGLTERQLDKFTHLNVERVIRDTLG